MNLLYDPTIRPVRRRSNLAREGTSSAPDLDPIARVD